MRLEGDCVPLYRRIFCEMWERCTDHKIDSLEYQPDSLADVYKRQADYPKAEEHIPEPTFALSWSHYLILMRVENPDARSFYEIECTQQQWSKRQLSRQVGSCLYELSLIHILELNQSTRSTMLLQQLQCMEYIRMWAV